MTTVFRIQGQDVWETTMSILHNPWFKIGEYLVVIAFVYHALNGLRLILQELGFLMGRPIPPIYPYRDSLRKKRPWTIAMVAVIVILALVFFYDFIIGGQ
jgi:succinate dehydrogenase / fumarate reductase cytochrome b subunit